MLAGIDPAQEWQLAEQDTGESDWPESYGRNAEFPLGLALLDGPLPKPKGMQQLKGLLTRMISKFRMPENRR